MKKLFKLLILLILVVMFATEIYAQGASFSDRAPKNIVRPQDNYKLPQYIPSKFINPGNSSGQKDSFCAPTYLYGCTEGDGFTDFAVEEIQNLGNGCEDNGGLGWSEYYTLGPANFEPLGTYTFTMSTGYSNQFVNIWIDFNDDLVLTSEELILEGFVLEIAGVFIDVEVTIPANATPGQHAMRAMTNWNGPFTDPCGSYNYGEAEDYYVIIATPDFGTLSGFVTENTGGAPVEGAIINVANGGYITTTAADGFYEIQNVVVGTWDVGCFKEGYNNTIVPVVIVQGNTTSQNFQLTQPQVELSSVSVSVILAPDITYDENINISNTGDGNVDWSAGVFFQNESSDALFDLQFDWPVGVGGGEAGIECDGNFIYTTKWDGAEFYRYELDGTFIGSFSCDGASGVRDLAWDGTYFYGASANATVFQMDFVNEVLVSQFTAPTDVRAIAYNEDENVFYANNWDSDIIAFDLAGANLGNFTVGPIGSSYYGFAYDNYSSSAPFLWGYAQTGNSLNELVQIQLPSGIETGLSFDVGSIAAVGDGIAGGLAITNSIVPGFYTLLGTSQNYDIWGLELCGSGPVWLTIDPNEGSLSGGQNQDMTLLFNTIGLIPGFYYAEIQFNSDPDVGPLTIDVTLNVEGLIPPINLDLNYSCTDVLINWDMPGGGTADSWNIYRDGSLLENTTAMEYTDAMLQPQTQYSYFIKAVYDGEESQATPVEAITLPMPVSLQPTGLEALINTPSENDITLNWDAPTGCLVADGFNVYRNGVLLNPSPITDMTFIDAEPGLGSNEYFVKAVYYFGESVASTSVTVIITGTNEFSLSALQIFPNPSSSVVYIQSPAEIIKIKALNSVGQTVFEKSIGATHFNLEVSALEPGIYYFKLETSEGDLVRKIMVN